MSSGTGSNYPANVVAGQSAGVNQAFQPFPYPNTTQAANNAYSGIPGDVGTGVNQALNNQVGSLINYGNTLGGQVGPIANNALGFGQGAANLLQGGYSTPVNAGTNLYNQMSQGAKVPQEAGVNVYNQLQGLVGMPIQAGEQLYGQGQQQYNALSPYVTQALQQGFDPQNALYNRQFGLQQQQNLASQAMSGVGQSPYAAGLTAQGNENFNIDWQNQQLARQQMGAQTAEGLSGQAMGSALQGANALNAGYNTGAGMLVQGANALNQGYQTGTAMNTAASNALNQGYATGLANELGAVSALGSGVNNYANLMGLGVSGLEGLTGAAGNAATQAGGLNAQQVAQYLAYLQGSTNNANAAINGQLGAQQQGTNLFGATNQGNLNQQQQTNAGLGGLGSLGGTLLGSNLGGLTSALGGAGAAGGASGLIDNALLGAAIL